MTTIDLGEKDRRILAYIAEHPGSSSQKIAQELNIPATTVSTHLKKLVKAEIIQSGHSVTDRYRKQIFKSFIFITTGYHGNTIAGGDELDYQPQLMREIQERIKSQAYAGTLFLESVEIVMGASFDIILILSAPDIRPIGRFVSNYLRPHRYVDRTKTITVWPAEPPIPDPVDEDPEASPGENRTSDVPEAYDEA